MEFEASFGNLRVEQSDDGLSIILTKSDELLRGHIHVTELDEDEVNLYVSAFKWVQYDPEKKELSCRKILGIPAWKCTLKRFYLNEDAQRLSEEVEKLEKEIYELKNVSTNMWKVYIDLDHGSGNYTLRCYGDIPNWPFRTFLQHYEYVPLKHPLTLQALNDKISSFNGHIQIQKMDLARTTYSNQSRYTGTIEGIFSDKKQVLSKGDKEFHEVWNMAVDFKDYKPWAKYIVARMKDCNSSGRFDTHFIPWSEA